MNYKKLVDYSINALETFALFVRLGLTEIPAESGEVLDFCVVTLKIVRKHCDHKNE